METPEFPLTITWLKENVHETYSTLNEIECNVEYIDTSNGQTEVRDSRGRLVVLRVVALSTEVCVLASSGK